MMDYGRILVDLAVEGQELDDLVADQSDWTRPTPAPGWTIAHQIAHLAWTDANVLTAMRAPAEFDAELARAQTEGERYIDNAAAAGAVRPRSALLAEWRAGRAELVTELAAAGRDRQLPWYGSTVSAELTSLIRMMETWAHGHDVFEALGVAHRPTARLKPVVWYGVLARDFSFSVAGLRPPSVPIQLTLTAPDGETWTWGPEDAPQRVTGRAFDFCLLTTHRRRLEDTDLVAVGADAQTWLETARVFLNRADVA